MQNPENITVDSYRQAFLTLARENRISDHQMSWLIAHYRAPNQVITATALAQVVGYETHHPINRWYGEPGKLVAGEVGYTPKAGWTWLSTFVTFDKESSPYPMRLRPNVITALEEIGWV